MRPLYFISKMDVDESGRAKISTHRVIDILDEEDIIYSSEHKKPRTMMEVIREAELQQKLRRSKTTVSLMPAVNE